MAVDEHHVYLLALNNGDVVLEIDKKTLTTGLTYGQSFEPNTVVVFDRRSGDRVGGIAATGSNLFVDRRILVQTTAGCCGPGIFIYDPETFELEQMVPRRFTNTVVRRGHWLIAGNEAGLIDVFDLSSNPSPLVSSINLPQVTGHTRPEDIEIRALWRDGNDNLIFAGSSWGNDATRGP